MLLPPSLQDWLPSDHPAGFIGEIAHDALRRELTPIKWRMYRLLKNGRGASNKKVAGMCADI
jgi:hypothetical protein